MELGFLLRLATCFARIAGLFAMRTLAGSEGGVGRGQVASEGPKEAGFGWGLLQLLVGAPRRLVKLRGPTLVHMLPQLLYLFLYDLYSSNYHFCHLNSLGLFLLQSLSFPFNFSCQTLPYLFPNTSQS